MGQYQSTTTMPMPAPAEVGRYVRIDALRPSSTEPHHGEPHHGKRIINLEEVTAYDASGNSIAPHRPPWLQHDGHPQQADVGDGGGCTSQTSLAGCKANCEEHSECDGFYLGNRENGRCCLKSFNDGIRWDSLVYEVDVGLDVGPDYGFFKRPTGAVLSSTLGGYRASECIDADATMHSFCHSSTAPDSDPWLRIDYGDSGAAIALITVHNRMLSLATASRIVGATIAVTADATGETVLWNSAFHGVQASYDFTPGTMCANCPTVPHSASVSCSLWQGAYYTDGVASRAECLNGYKLTRNSKFANPAWHQCSDGEQSAQKNDVCTGAPLHPAGAPSRRATRRASLVSRAIIT
jgi:hypothetical protein